MKPKDKNLLLIIILILIIVGILVIFSVSIKLKERNQITVILEVPLYFLLVAFLCGIWYIRKLSDIEEIEKHFQ